MSRVRSALRRLPWVWTWVLALAALCAVRQTSDWDTPWHLRAGHQALLSRTTLPVDLFSYSFPGAPWPYKDLLAEILLYLAFAGFGYAGLALLKGLCAAGAALGLYLAQPPPRRAALPWLVAVSLLLAATAYRYAERPLIFSLALSPLLLAALERARRGAAQRGPRALLQAFLPLVAVQGLWLQLHREGMTGLVLLTGFALYLGAAWVARRASGLGLGRLFAVQPSGAAVGAAWLALLASVPLGLLNLCGAQFYRTSFSALRGIGWQEQIIHEWQALPLPQLLTTSPSATLLCVGAAAGLLVRLCLRPARGADLLHLGAWLLFAYQTQRSIRWLHFLAEVSALIWLLLGAEVAAWLAARGPRAPRGLPLLAALLGGLLVAHSAPAPWGLGEVPDRFPGAALAFAERHRLRERVLNAFPFGGYLLWRGWPRLRPLVDGRNDQLYPPEFMRACYEAEGDPAAFARLRAAYPADWVLAANLPGHRSHRFLDQDPGWLLLHSSDVASVYVQRGAYPQLEPLALRYAPLLRRGAPLAAVLAQARGEPGGLERLTGELSRMVEEAPADLSSNRWLAALYDALGPAYQERRDAVMRRFLQLRPAALLGGSP